MDFPVSIIEVLLFLILCTLVINNITKNEPNNNETLGEILLFYIFLMIIIFIVSVVAYYALNLLVMIGFSLTGLDFWGQR